MISIIIPAHDEEEHIIKCLDAIKEQNFKGISETIVVDNNSTDKTAELVTRYKKFHPELDIKLIFEKEKGIAKA